MAYNPAMLLEFSKAVLPQDTFELHKLDVGIFGDNAFSQDDWLSSDLETYWVLLDGFRAGCTAFYPNTDFKDDISEDGENVPQEGSLYILTTGLAPRYQGLGLGRRVKAWQIEYAKRSGFKRIVTNCRASNSAMISINEKNGFRAIRTTDQYYEDGEATVMELLL